MMTSGTSDGAVRMVYNVPGKRWARTFNGRGSINVRFNHRGWFPSPGKGSSGDDCGMTHPLLERNILCLGVASAKLLPATGFRKSGDLTATSALRGEKASAVVENTATNTATAGTSADFIIVNLANLFVAFPV